MSRTWKDNAAEFGVLSKQGSDVRLALLVACSVEPDNGHGVGKGQAGNVANVTFPGKVSARKFATEANTTPDRVLRHLKAWNRLAVAPYRLVLPSEDLTVRDTDGLRAFKGDDAWLLDQNDRTWRAVFADVSKKVNEEEPPGSRPRAPISEIDGALANRDGYAARLVTGLSDEGFTALVEAIEEATTATVPEVDPDLPEPPPAKPTKKRSVVDDWAARKAKQDLAERQARLDAELEQIKLDAIARGGKVPAPSAKDPITMESMFGERFTAWSELTQVLADAARRLTAFRETYGDLLDEETTVLRASAVGLLDIAAGTHRFTEVGGVVPR